MNKKNRERMAQARANESPAQKETRLKKQRDQRIEKELKSKINEWLSTHIDSFIPESGTAEQGYPSRSWWWKTSPLYG